MTFKCAEFAGCEENVCSYEGEEACHWRNIPVPGCTCADCRKVRDYNPATDLCPHGHGPADYCGICDPE